MIKKGGDVPVDLLETTLTSTPRFHGAIVDVRTDTVRLPDGREAGREVVSHPGGVAILPLGADGQVTLVRQFRYPIGEVLLEVPAGKLERGEDPRPAALRELEEEVGVIPERLNTWAFSTSPPASPPRSFTSIWPPV